MMNIVCVVLGIVSVVSIGLLIFMVNMFNKACEKWHKAEQELKEFKGGYVDALDEKHELQCQLEEAKQEAKLYDLLLGDVYVAYWSHEEYADFESILAEHSALMEGKTTGYKYHSDEEANAQLLEGYELIVEEDYNDVISDEEYIALRDEYYKEIAELEKQYDNVVSIYRNR